MFADTQNFVSTAAPKMVQDNEEPVYIVAIDDIDVSDPLRPIDPILVQIIAASMVKEGQLTPIDICHLPSQASGKPFRRVCGSHRIAAARSIGWTTIKTFIRSSRSIDRLAREIAENLFRVDLNPLDRAAFVAELYRIEKLRAGHTVDADGRAHSAKVRWEKELKRDVKDATVILTGAYSMTEAVAEAAGLNKTAVERDLTLYRRLSPSVVTQVRNTPIGSNASQLRALAKLDPAKQTAVVEQLVAGKAKGVSDALAIVDRKPVERKEDKLVGNFLGTFARMTPAQKAEALRLLAGQMPKGWEVREVKDRVKMPTLAEIRELTGADAVVDIEEMVAAKKAGGQ